MKPYNPPPSPPLQPDEELVMTLTVQEAAEFRRLKEPPPPDAAAAAVATLGNTLGVQHRQALLHNTLAVQRWQALLEHKCAPRDKRERVRALELDLAFRWGRRAVELTPLADTPGVVLLYVAYPDGSGHERPLAEWDLDAQTQTNAALDTLLQRAHQQPPR